MMEIGPPRFQHESAVKPQKMFPLSRVFEMSERARKGMDPRKFIKKQNRAIVYLHKLLDLVCYEPSLANDECKKVYDLVMADLAGEVFGLMAMHFWVTEGPLW